MSAGLDYQPHFEECIVCKRKILVELVQFGVSHVAGINAICQRCVLQSPTWTTFKVSHPAQAKEIEKWAKQK